MELKIDQIKVESESIHQERKSKSIRCYIDNLNRQKQIIFYFIVIIVLAILIYGIYFNSLNNNFVNWDEPGLILNNKRIRSLEWQNIKEILTLKKASTYQPIRVLSYAVDYHFWKLNPMGYRITNIIFYILTCIMVFFTLRILSTHLRERASPDSHFRIALFGSLLFAVHPVHVEAVTWLAARKEVLQGVFFFLALLLYLKGRERSGKIRLFYLFLVLFTILLAILSKPSAVVFPAVILVYEIARKKDSILVFLKDHWIFFTLTIIISAVFALISIKVMLDAGGVKPYYGKGFLENLLVVLYVFLRSIKLLAFTVNYSAAYSFSVLLPVYHIKNILFVLIVVFLFGLSFWSLKRTKVIFFSLFFFLITLSPYLNIIPISTLLADRYVFIASFAYCFVLGVIFDRFYLLNNKRFSPGFFKLLSISIFILLMAGYSYMTIHQNTIWRNSYTLWADAVKKHPNSNTANALMGVVYMELGMDEEAIKYLEKAVQILPYDYQSRNNLGVVYGRNGQPEKALKEFMTALWLKPDHDKIKINLAVFYQRQKEYKKAEEVFKHLISRDPNNSNLHFRLGMLYNEMEDYNNAISEFEKSMKLAPNIINSYEELGKIYASKFKDYEKAKYYYSKGIEMAPKAKSKIEELKQKIHDLETKK